MTSVGRQSRKVVRLKKSLVALSEVNAESPFVGTQHNLHFPRYGYGRELWGLQHFWTAHDTEDAPEKVVWQSKNGHIRVELKFETKSITHDLRPRP